VKSERSEWRSLGSETRDPTDKVLGGEKIFTSLLLTLLFKANLVLSDKKNVETSEIRYLLRLRSLKGGVDILKRGSRYTERGESIYWLPPYTI
jgi:hypothetical protein